jgi:anoctamin-10
MSVQNEGTVTGIPYFTSLSDSIYHLKIALLTSSSLPAMAKSKALQSNLDVDYVISYRFAKTGMFVDGGGMRDYMLTGV